MKKFLVTIAMVLVFPILSYGYDTSKTRGAHRRGGEIHIDTATPLTDTWTCAAYSGSCTADTTSGNAATILANGDWVICGSGSSAYSFEVTDVDGGGASEDAFTRVRETKPDGTYVVPNSNAVAITAQTCYKFGTGLTSSLQVVEDSGDTDSALWLATDQIASIADGGNAALELLQLTNNNEPATGETGDTAAIRFDLYGSIDSGSTFVTHEAAMIEAYKISDWWHAADETDHDSGVKFYTADGGVRTLALTLISNDMYVADGSVFGMSLYIKDGHIYDKNTSDIYWSSTAAYNGASDVSLSRYNDGSIGWLAVDDGGGDGAGDGGVVTTTYMVGGTSGPKAINNSGTWQFRNNANDANAPVQAASIVLDTYTRYHTVDASGANLGPTAPTLGRAGTYGCLSFDADAESVSMEYEVPPDWVDDTSMTLKIYWVNCASIGSGLCVAGDPIANGETAKFDISYRVVDFDAGEIYNNGSVATGTVTYTEAGSPGTDGEAHESEITLAYDNANQPLEYGHVIGILFDRDVTGDTYSGTTCIIKWEIALSSNTVPSH